jgi:hypothetical protein
MNEQQIKEILEDPNKMLNLLRLLHQLLHIYDENEFKKMTEKKQKPAGIESAGLGDTLSAVLKDKDGNVKQEIK